MRGEEIDRRDVKRKGGQIVKIGELKVVIEIGERVA